LTVVAVILNFTISYVTPGGKRNEPRAPFKQTKVFPERRQAIKPLKAKRAWAVAYDPEYYLQMAGEYDEDRLEQLNACLAKGGFALVSEDTQGFAGDLMIDFNLELTEPYRALIMP
jgi:hypothetical protein